jgi:ABC-2 type transport system permease protein
MNKVFQLTRVLMKTVYDNVGISSATKQGKKPKRSKTQNQILYGTLFVLIIASLSFPLYLGVRELVTLLVPTGLHPLMWYLIIPMSLIVILVMSIFTIISVFFLSSDNAMLLPLPLKPWQILAARYITTLVMPYIIEIVLLVPIFIGYGVAVQAGVDFYLLSLLALFSLPWLPTSVLGILLSLLMRYVNLAKHKDVFTYVSMFLVLGISMGVSFLFSSTFSAIEVDPAQAAENITAMINQIGYGLTRYLPFTIPGIQSLIHPELGMRILNGLFFFAINGVVVAAFLIGGSPLYLHAIRGTGETTSKRKVLNQTQMQAQLRRTPLFRNYIAIEWKLMLRSPIYFSNLILVVILVPIIMIISFAASFSAVGADEDIAQLMEMLHFNMSDPMTFVIGFAVLLFFGSVNMIASTAISRMGKSAEFIKYIPVPVMQQLHAKMYWGFVLSILASLFPLIMIAALGFVPWYDALLLVPPLVMTYLLLNYLGLLIDLRHPRLNWTNEAAAVKSNFNGLFYMLISWVLLAAYIGLGYLASLLSLPGAGYYLAAVITLIMGGASYMLYRLMNKPSILDRI